jgi:hypothetical protein
MCNTNRQEIVTNTLDMIDSLMKAIDQAGGYVSLDELRKMTVEQFINEMCTNKIRFIYETKTEKGDN